MEYFPPEEALECMLPALTLSCHREASLCVGLSGNFKNKALKLVIPTADAEKRVCVDEILESWRNIALPELSLISRWARLGSCELRRRISCRERPLGSDSAC